MFRSHSSDDASFVELMLKSILLFAAPSKHLLPWKNRVQIAIDVANALVSFRKSVIVSFFLSFFLSAEISVRDK